MTATFYVGDVLDVLDKLPENSVDLVLSSPPFLALRSYLPADHPLKNKEGGSQSTPGEYIDWLLDVVEACDRVLAPHGSLCFELGDTYAGSGGAGGDYSADGLRAGQPAFTGSGRLANYNDARGNPDGMRDTTFSGGNTRTGGGTGWALAKSLSLIPESFRFAMVYGFNPFTGRQTERWRLRNVIRWVRPNPPVGTLGDKFRPATSELMVFCKSAKRYFDLDAVREPFRGDGVAHGSPSAELGQTIRKASDALNERALAAGSRRMPVTMNTQAGAPPLDWWNIPPGGYEGAHYAVWPPELLIKPIKAMCPEFVCRTCGEARRRIVEKTKEYAAVMAAKEGRKFDLIDGKKPEKLRRLTSDRSNGSYQTLGFTDCGHNDYRPGLVLDPFVGSGTTLAVATGHGRDAIGVDLDSRNWDLALERVGPLVLQRGEVAA